MGVIGLLGLHVAVVSKFLREIGDKSRKLMWLQELRNDGEGLWYDLVLVHLGLLGSHLFVTSLEAQLVHE